MNYQQIPLDKRPARGRNGVFDAELMEITVANNMDSDPPFIIVEIWSRRRAEGQAPISFALSMNEAMNVAHVITSMISGTE